MTTNEFCYLVIGLVIGAAFSSRLTWVLMDYRAKMAALRAKWAEEDRIMANQQAAFEAWQAASERAP